MPACCENLPPEKPDTSPSRLTGNRKTASKIRYLATAAVALTFWWLAYSKIEAFARWLIRDVAALPADTPLGDALEFFIYDTLKIFLLLILTVYVIGWLRASLPTGKIRDFLAGKSRSAGYLLGAVFGAVTPFCSCSSVPLFIGFTTARIPPGITMAFLITSPLINEIAVILLWSLIGWQFTLIYIATGLFCGMAGGFLMDALSAERWLQPFLQRQPARPVITLIPARPAAPPAAPPKTGWSFRHRFALSETRGIFRRVWLWIVIGVGLGAALHGFVPQEWFAAHSGPDRWWSVPLAVMAGIPLYTNVTGIVPVMESLLNKGLPVGTTLAFCMGTVAASLPELVMLKQVMRWPLLALFVAVLFVLLTATGWLYNFLAPILL
ncbi:permease [Oxalobacter paraformigenes]|uniref:Permease n=1 Tax=Oxalobacter paraformigenes TaxID=556268 RepID=C3X3Y2_9BURK|nr:permease [Oxalobacter paraformigenes]EEO27918.1 hypothetical protein OFAG_01071 [Oxalobacter paraformigenes]